MSAGRREKAWRVVVVLTTFAALGSAGCGGEKAQEPRVAPRSSVGPGHQEEKGSKGNAKEASKSKSSRKGGSASRDSRSSKRDRPGDGRIRLSKELERKLAREIKRARRDSGPPRFSRKRARRATEVYNRCIRRNRVKPGDMEGALECLPYLR